MDRRAFFAFAALAVLTLLPVASTGTRLGGIERASPDEDHIQHVANYAVQQVNEMADGGSGDLILDKVLSARKQLVAGTLYFLTLQAVEGGSGKLRKFEVSIYEPFGQHTNTLKLTHYKEAGKVAPKLLQPAEQQDEDEDEDENEQTVPVDQTISEGAVRAIMQFNQMSNSLVPWTLKEVLAASTVSGEADTYLLTMRVARGQDERDYEVKLRRTDEDSWLVLGTFVPVEADIEYE